MTFPCVNEGQIEVNPDVELTPRAYMAWRHVATASLASSLFTPTFGGAAINTLIGDVTATWTNTTPIPQIAYAILTRAGSGVVTQARSRLFINTSTGVSSGPVAPAPTLTLTGRMGVGIDLGITGGTPQVYFGISEHRQAQRATLVGTNTVIPPTQQFKARFELRMVSDNWETTAVVGGVTEFEASVRTGESRIDIFAYPQL